ncbi:alcohol dehydrogenase catalytic domain-containing protein [Aestuariibius sp. HNIBRBA575]|uniref:alcohol dehydrogenase catalytic domain-containing protein n=1 Tax=Aestuariibius sp. HNIBRBA575 TaxID=3233343 RepID=UPI0034A517FB
MTLIKAAVCHDFGQPLQIQDVALRNAQAGELGITLEAVAICHSDISYADGAWGGSLPAVYGHEAAGRVTQIGDGVTGINLGDRVVVTLIRSCGTCPTCSSGKPVICETPYDGDTGPLTMADGSKLHQAMACGAFAEKVVVHQSQVVRVADTLSPESAALLACGVITGVGAVVNAAQLRAGQDVVVIGAGGVGLNAIQGARIAGARRIIAVDMTQDKLNVARDFGATDGVLIDDPAVGGKPWRAAKQAMGRGADAVFVTVGVSAAYDDAPRYLAPAGRVYMVGMPHVGAKSTYEPVMMAAVGQGMIGTKMGDTVIRRDIPWMVDMYEQGRLKLDELIAKRWRLDQINDAIADTKSGVAGRNIIMF